MPVISEGGGGAGLGVANTIHGSAAAGIPLDIIGGSGQGAGDFADLLRALDSSQAYGLEVDSSGDVTMSSNGAAGAIIFITSGGANLRLLLDGLLFRGMTAAPASTEIASGNFTLWLDATAGAAKLMVKAKDNNGTVVAGSLALA